VVASGVRPSRVNLIDAPGILLYFRELGGTELNDLDEPHSYFPVSNPN
jgi:hypothetical protein